MLKLDKFFRQVWMKVKHVSTHSNTVTNFPVTQQHRRSLTVTQNFHHSNKDLPWKLVPSCSLLADGPTSVILWVPFYSSIMFPDCQAALPMIAAISQPAITAQLSIGTDDKFRNWYRLQIANFTNTIDKYNWHRVIIPGYYRVIIQTNRRSAQLQLLHWGGLPNYSSHHWLIQIYTLV